MKGPPPARPGSDPILLLEAGLIVLLLILFIFLYILPTERRLSGLGWWSPLVLGGVSLAVLVVDGWRRRRRYRREMQAMREEYLGDER